MSRGRPRAGGSRGNIPGLIVVVMLAAAQVGPMVARAGPPELTSDPVTPGEVPLTSDLTIALSNDPAGPVLDGDPITYTLSISNRGDASATGVEVIDELPPGIAFSEATAGCVERDGLVTCTLDEIGAGASVDLGIGVTVVGSCGAIVNTAVVSASNGGVGAITTRASNPVTNDVRCEASSLPATHETTPGGAAAPAPPDLQISKSSSADGILHDGDDFLYTITVANVGEEDATDVAVTDTLPRGALHVAVPPFPRFAGALCTVTSSAPPGGLPRAEIRCGPVSLAPGDSASVVFKAIVSDDVCGSITNVARVEGANEPAVLVGPDNRAEASDRVACRPRIRLSKDGPSMAHVGDTISYVFSATNDGTVDLASVTLSDPSCDGPATLADDGDGDDVLSIREEWRFRCGHAISTGDGDPLRSRATIAGAHPGGVVTDSDTHGVNVLRPGIDLEQRSNRSSASVGALIIYTYTITNTGDTALFDVSVMDDRIGRVAAIPTLAPGQTVQLTHPITLGSSPISNASTAEGSDLLGASVRDVDGVTVRALAGDTGGVGGPGGSPFTGSDGGGLVRWIIVLTSLGAILLRLSRSAPRTSGDVPDPSTSTT